MPRKHQWKTVIFEAGHQKIKCKRCGATKESFRIGGTEYSPAELHGKRQLFCPKEI